MRLRQRALTIAVLFSLLLFPSAGSPQVPSQNLSVPGGYQAIPNFSGPGAGLLFRTAINDRFSGVQQISPRLVTLGFSNLPAEQDGLLLYCVDCAKTIPCAGGGTGAWAFGQNGAWTCTAPNLPGAPLYSGQTGATLNSLTGSGTTPSLSGMSVNGVINVQAYGASGAGINVTTGTISASSASLSVASASGWSAGMGIVVPHAGAATTLATPGAPTVRVNGTAGSTSYTYKCVAMDNAHGYTPASAGATITTGPATFAMFDYNQIACPAVAGATLYAAYQTAPGSYLVGISTGTHFADQGGAFFPSKAYTGSAFWDIPSTAPSSAAADWLRTTVSSISGTTFTLAASATTAASGVGITHDDSAPISNAIATNGAVYFPAGNYFYCGGAMTPNQINVTGARHGQSLLYTCPGEYTFDVTNYMYGLNIRNMTFVGGIGAFMMDYAGADDSAAYTENISDNVFADYTGAAIAMMPVTDIPFWKIDHNSFAGLDDNATIGVLANSSSGNQILNNAFTSNRVFIKALGGGALIQGNSFVRDPQPNPQVPRVAIWAVLNSAPQEFSGFTVHANKFGDENLQNSDVQVLAADDDSSSGSNESNYMPLYRTADDLAITSAGSALTSAAECPFTAAMCQGGSGCTGALGNWPIAVELAGTAPSNVLTTTITGFTNSCSVTVGNAANATVTGTVGRFAPAETTNEALYLNFSGNDAQSNANGPGGVDIDPFAVGTFKTGSGYGWKFAADNLYVPTVLEFLPTIVPANYNEGIIFSGDTSYTTETSQNNESVGAVLAGDALQLGAGDTTNGLVASPQVARLASYWAGVAVEGTTGLGNAANIFGVFANDGASSLLTLSTNQATGMTVNENLNVSWALNINGTGFSQGGTAGTANCVEPLTGSALKTVSCYLNAYQETGTAQTFTFPTAFSTAPVLLESGGSCGTYNPSATATVLTLPANASMTAETCNVIAEGQ